MLSTTRNAFTRLAPSASRGMMGRRSTPFASFARTNSSRSHSTNSSAKIETARTQSSNWFGILAAFGGVTLVSAALYSQQANAKEEEQKKSLNPNEFKAYKLKEIIPYNHNTRIYRFALETPETVLGLPVASCFVVKANIDGKPVIRPYTPITSDDQKGFFDVLVKEYPTGVMSKHIANLKVGDTLEVKGPISKIPYKANMKKKIGMIAGGSGITPMYQVIDQILKNPNDKTEVTLVFGNVTEEDILLRERFDKWAKEHKNFHVHYILDRPPSNWKGLSGFVNSDVVKKLMPEPSNDNLVMVCGPLPMMKSVSGEKAPDYSQGEVGGVLKDLGYTKEHVFKF